jgi:hypothetical protein
MSDTDILSLESLVMELSSRIIVLKTKLESLGIVDTSDISRHRFLQSSNTNCSQYDYYLDSCPPRCVIL